jgi:hypothetical protein
MHGVGEGMLEAFKEHMGVFGEDFHAGGETRRGVYSDHKGVKKISFLPGEFPLRAGDVIKRWATEENFKVLFAKSEAVAGVIINFHASSASSCSVRTSLVASASATCLFWRRYAFMDAAS